MDEHAQYDATLVAFEQIIAQNYAPDERDKIDRLVKLPHRLARASGLVSSPRARIVPTVALGP